MATKLSNYNINVPDGQIVHSKVHFTAAIADHSARAAINTTAAVINVPGRAGSIYTLLGVQILNQSTLTTTVNTGGLVELTNDGIDWLPTELLFNTSEILGAAGGASQNPTFIPLNKPLPAGSNITVYYTSRNAATDYLQVTLFWSWKQYSGPQTFSKSGYGTARTSVATFTSDISIAIPANKGGNTIGFLAQCYGVIVTVLSVGGKMAVHNTAANPAYEPCEFLTPSLSCIASGGGESIVQKVDYAGDCPGNSTFTIDTTTISTNSQVFGACVVWEA